MFKTAKNSQLIADALFYGNLAVITAVWFNYLPPGKLTPAVLTTDIGHITGLIGAYLILVQLILMSRVWLLERAYGMEQLNRIHRRNGYYVFGFLAAHIIFITIGYQLSTHSTFITQFKDFLFNFSDIMSATIGTVIFIAATVTSVRWARKKMNYEWWYVLHFATYFAVALSFQHQIHDGLDFIGHNLFQTYWWALYIVTFIALVWFRFLWPIVQFNKYRFRVVKVEQETANSYSIYLDGKGIDRFRFEPGQFAVWHPLDFSHFWHGHPFSFSTAPGGKYIRFTAKASGDFTKRIQEYFKAGRFVVIDGPHGKLTPEVRKTGKLLLIAGGIGITPLRSLLADANRRGEDVVLMYGCKNEQDAVFKKEIERMQAQRNFPVHYFYTRAPGVEPQYINEQAIHQFAPDVAQRDIYLCGPIPMMTGIAESLQKLNVPLNQIHTEKFEFA